MSADDCQAAAHPVIVAWVILRDGSRAERVRIEPIVTAEVIDESEERGAVGYVLTDCIVIDCTGVAPLPDAAVLVEGDRIADVGPAAEVRARAGGGHRIVALDGAALLPGLWDAHIHLGGTVPPWYERFGAQESESAYAYRCLRKAMDNLMAGVTSLRTMSDRFGADLHLKNAIDRGYLIGPRLFVSGEAMWSREVAGEAEFRRRARALLWGGADHIKLFASSGIPHRGETIAHPTCTLAELRAAVEEAHRWRKPACVHAIGDEAVVMAAEAGADVVEHGFVLGDEGIAAMARHGAVYSPQLAVTAAWSERPMREAGCYPDWLIVNANEAGAHHHAAFRKAVRAGITIVAGVDNLPRQPLSVGIETFEGRTALVAELRLMVENGLSPMGALQAATVNTARSARVGHLLGTIEPGKLADLVAVAGNPLVDIGALHDIRLVMKDGVVVRAAEGALQLAPGARLGAV